jgi:UDP-N-acetylglucosamine--N-acetylmuramyl-(pentapeptide) pyrophosphoryl-undecaprenol N-acetylglucosamine transferase
MRCVIAGGGTGGHLFPGIAIAEAFLQREKGNEILFIGTERGIEKKVLAGKQFPLKMINVAPLKGRSFLGKVKVIWGMPMAVAEAAATLKEFRPHFVLGVGGYASGPALLAAFLLGMKRAIHEQNIVPGMTNRMLRWFSQQIFVSYEETKKYFPEGKTRVTGNPVRSEILSCEGKRGRREKGERFTLFIFGGSAGAHRINQAVVEALDQLQEIKSSLRFIHQTGRDDLDFVSKGYQEKGFDASVRPFFEEMAAIYQSSNVVICRAGASTLAELAVCGKAAILIPYPYAAHQHQLINARKLVDLHAARMIQDKELNGTSLAQTIVDLYLHPEECAAMEQRILQVGRPRAAQEIVDHCYALVGKSQRVVSR